MRGSRRVAIALVAGRALSLLVKATPLPTILRRCHLVPPAMAVSDVVAAIETVERLWRRVPRGSGTCLTRSIWRVFAARRCGLPLRFVVGVRLSPTKQIEAHAWLELDGDLFMERDPAVPAGFTRAFEDPPSTAMDAVSFDGVVFR